MWSCWDLGIVVLQYLAYADWHKSFYNFCENSDSFFTKATTTTNTIEGSENTGSSTVILPQVTREKNEFSPILKYEYPLFPLWMCIASTSLVSFGPNSMTLWDRCYRNKPKITSIFLPLGYRFLDGRLRLITSKAYWHQTQIYKHPIILENSLTKQIFAFSTCLVCIIYQTSPNSCYWLMR